jgi:hypothetical protein
MYLEYPEQEAAYTSRQQYMFGKELLVAPITAPGNGKPARKEVYLPAGQDWFDFFTGDLYGGGKAVTHECPPDRMPLFVRAGSILPMAPEMAYSDQKPADPLTLDVYAGSRPAEFNLYEDDGVSLDYRAAAYAWTPLRFGSEKPGHYTLSIGPVQGKFQGQLAKRRYVVRVHGLFKPDDVALNGHKLPETEPCHDGPGWSWNGRERLITVRLPKPLPISKDTVVEFANAGSFADLSAWQRAWNLREQLRQAKRDMKLKDANLLGGLDVSKPPRVIRETEDVERLLTDIVDHPNGCGQAPPDYAALEQRVLAALTHAPFDSTRTLREFDPEHLKAMEVLKTGKFTAEELQTITNRFRGADLPAWLWSGK